ncbi:MAG: hypothetical protein Q9224_001712 [Gallowayella concinna]
MGGDEAFISRLNITFEIDKNHNGDARLANTLFNPADDVTGLPGNSDSVAMQTWLSWSMIDLHPMTGQTTFLIGSTWFDMTIDLGGRKRLKILRKEKVDYVHYMRVIKVVWEKNWLT